MKKKIVAVAITLLVSYFFFSCKKDMPDDNNNHQHGHLKQTKNYSSDVIGAWMNFDLRLLRNNSSLNNFIMMQHWAYSSIAVYEAVVPGMPSYQTLAGQLNQMPSMPDVQPGMNYHWPTCANVVFAEMVRNFYPGISAADKAATDSLESWFNTKFMTEANAETFQRSVNFGKEVAMRVFDWSKSDGSLTVHPAYIIPAGPGLWEPTPPAFSNPQNPYWRTNRPLIPGSIEASQISLPVQYSSHPASAFYHMVKEVYDASLILTSDQMEQAIFWRDIPGGGTHAHWMSILIQVLENEKNRAMLDKAALAYVKMGITQSEGRLSCWDSKYTYNLVRPVTYIRSVMTETSWNSFLTTPNHPEYPSAHSTFSAAGAVVLTELFGDNYHYTDHTFDFLGLPARSYNSFNHAATEAGLSRFYGGIHYIPSLEAGNLKGTSLVNYMNNKIKFKK